MLQACEQKASKLHLVGFSDVNQVLQWMQAHPQAPQYSMLCSGSQAGAGRARGMRLMVQVQPHWNGSVVLQRGREGPCGLADV